MAQAQDSLIMTLDPIKYESLLNDEGREQVKVKIRKALNRLGRSGSVEEVYFSTFLGS